MAAGVAGEVPGDVQDPVAQAFGFRWVSPARHGLGPDDHVVRYQREFEPRGVRLEAVEGQVVGAGRLQCLDAVLDDRVLAMENFELGDVGVGLVGDEALEAMPVEIGERQLGAGCGRSRRQISRVRSGQSGRLTLPVSSVTQAPSRGSAS